MAMNIKNKQVEGLLNEVVSLSGETKTETVRQALLLLKSRLSFAKGRPPKQSRLNDFFARRIWPRIPPELLGTEISKAEEERILGYDCDLRRA